GHQRQLVPLMSIAVANYDDEDNHRREPPMKKPRERARSCDERPDEREREKQRSQTRRHYLFRDLPIPARAHNLNSARAEKVVRIKFVGHFIGVPILNRGWQQRNRSEWIHKLYML